MSTAPAVSMAKVPMRAWRTTRHHPVHVVEVEGGHHDKPLRQANTPVEGEGDEGDDRHEAQTAQLDHGQDDRLTEQRPLGPRVHQDQAGDAGGGGGGEQSGEEPGALSVPGGDGRVSSNAPIRIIAAKEPATIRVALRLRLRIKLSRSQSAHFLIKALASLRVGWKRF